MYDEMRFLFSVDPYIKNSRNTNNRTINQQNPAQSLEEREEISPDDGEKYVRNNYVITRGDVKNFIKSEVNKGYKEGANPYIELIKYTNDPNTAKSLKLKSSDFAYLRDIGVMPINRLIILRRFPEGATVPVDLSNYNVEPTSVVIGWVKKDTDLLNFNFGENWSMETTPLHERLQKIIKDEFGVDISQIVPIPGWGLGFMFGLLKKMGLTDFDEYNLPFGDPNLLKESLTRDIDKFGLKSGFKFDFETNYEQKYISGIDPVVSTFDILRNLLNMGTSNVTTLGKTGSEFIQKLRAANENPTDPNGWSTLVEFIIEKFIESIKETIINESEELSSLMGTLLAKPPLEKKEEPDNTDTGNNTQPANMTELEKARLEAKNKASGILEVGANVFETLLNTKLIRSILASTIARYRWPIRGSIGMMTGEATTPWHITIGNPYSPLLSMNNIYVSDVSVTFGKDMNYNDIPKTMNVKITMTQGRNLGKQEINKLFGINYKRYYKKIDR